MINKAILAIDLSTPRGQVAVVRAEAVLYEVAFVSERSHNSMLYTPLQEALEIAGQDLALVVVGTGPGSYTGVRISIAAGHGIGLSRSIPIIGWPSIATLDEAQAYTVIGDARRGNHYAAWIRNGRLQGQPSIMPAAETASWIAQSEEAAFTSDAKPPSPAVIAREPSATRLASIAASLGEEAVWTLAERGVEPLYVEEAFITKPKRPVTA